MKKILFMFLALFAMTFFAKAQVPVLTADFEGTTMPSGWTTIDADNDGFGWELSSVQEDIYGYNSNGSVVSYSYDNATYTALTPNNWLISPAINLIGTSSLSFWFVVAQSYPGDHFGVYVSTTSATDTSAFTSVFDYTPTSANGAWTQQTIDLSSYAGNTVYIAFRHFNCTDMFLLALDDIVVSSGTTQTMVAANPSSVNFGMVYINEHSAVAPIQVVGANTTAAITATVNAPFEISTDSMTFGSTASLPAAGGMLYARYSPTTAGSDNDSISLSSGTVSASVTLTGTAVDCNLTLPYTETFESNSPYLSCWTVSGDASWSVGTGDYSSSTGAYAGSTNALITHTSTGNVTKLISPVLTGVNTGLSLDFAYVMRSWSGDIDELRVYSRADANSAWQQVAAYTDAASTWTLENVIISGSVYQVAFEHTDNYGYGLGIDNVVFTPMTPNFCYPVTGLTASNVTAHEATLTWSGTTNSYTIYDMSDTSVVATVTDTTYTLTGLTSDTQHTFGVVANCSSESSTTVLVSFHTLISCPVPTGLAAVLTPGNGTVATLNWNEAGTATAWQICLNGDETNLIDVTDTTYNLTGLTAEQACTAKVRAVCDANDHSAWSATITFTPTNAYQITVNDGTTTNSYVPVYGLWVDDITKSQFIIPAADLAAMQFGAINKLTFYANNANVNWGVATFDVYVTETSETTLSALADYTTMNQVYAGTLSIANNKMEVTFTNPYTYMGGNLMIGFLQTLSGTYSSCSWYGVSATGASMGGYGSSVSQRNFLPKTTIDYTPGTAPACLPVTNLTASNVTSDGATLNWIGTSADSYTIYDMSDSSVVATVTDTTYTFTGLTPMTHYIFGVVANCGSDHSIMVSVSFNTACSVIAIPFTETFETTSTTLGCWAVANVAANTGITTTNPYNGSNAFVFAYNTNPPQYLISPELSGTDNGLAVSLMYRIQSTSYPESFALGYSTTTNDITAFTWGVEQTNLVNTTYQEYSEIMPAGVKYVAIKYTANNMYYLFIDDVTFATPPSCLPVTALTVDTATSNSVTISWNGTAPSYDVYNGNTFVANVTTTSYTFTGLTTASNYTFGVQAICSATDSAAMVTVAASTGCGIIDVYPYVQDFATTPACWTAIDADGDGYNWSLYQGAIQSASYVSSALTPDNWLISPQFAIPATGSYEVTWSATAQDQSWPAEHYGVFVSTTGNTDTANFTMLQEWTLSTGVFNPVIDLSSYAGQNIYIALRHFNCTDQFRISIDDFTVREQAGANQVVINVGQNNPAYGTVTGAGVYNIGDSVTVSATPATGYNFSKWVDDNNNILSTANPYTFVAATNLDLTAIFLNDAGTTYTITVQVNDSTMGTATGGGTYTAGDLVTLTATANAGYQFVNWTQSSDFGINVVGTDPSITITVTSDKTFIANFAADTTAATQYTVTVSAADATMGTVTPSGSTTVDEGTSFTVTATPNTNYIFVNWTDAAGNVVSTANPYTFTVTEDVTLVANFMFDDAINDVTLANSINLMPNPASNYIELRINSNVNVNEALVYNAFGQLVQTVQLTGNQARIDLSNVAPGMYFVRINSGNMTATKKFIRK